jgi:NAD-dependent DNA ligase
MKRSDQFTWLHTNGFLVPWWIIKDTPTEEVLKTFFTERRQHSSYDTDGIVVGIDNVPVKITSTDSAPKPPKDCVAFKMPVSDQSAITTVEEVLWTPSAQGYLIPRIRIKPVQIGGAVIEFCTGHNARMIEQHKVGPGAKIMIRRSGDVIPKLDKVLVAAVASFPPDGTWEWSGDAHIKSSGHTTALTVAKLHYFLKTLEIPGAGPATAAALVEAGITGPAKLWAATADTLSKALGPKTGASLHANLRTALAGASEATLMHASSMMPRGVGDTKLASLFAAEADPRKWLNPTAGWTADSFQAFMKELPAYVAWRTKEISWIPYPILQVSSKPKPSTEVICMTGFRDKALEEKGAQKGYSFVPTLTGKVTILLVPDGEVKDSEKVKTARAKGIKILSRSSFTQQYLA